MYGEVAHCVQTEALSHPVQCGRLSMHLTQCLLMLSFHVPDSSLGQLFLQEW